jgi:hypothetical protein
VVHLAEDNTLAMLLILEQLLHMKAEWESHTIKIKKMKKAVIISTIVSSIFLNGYSQNVDDALRYSQTFYNGTARFVSMGGAFTALGGDLSAISLNPAATGVFRSFEFNITPQMTYNNNSAAWNGKTTSDFKYTMNIGQVGVVFNLFPVKKETGLVSLNFAYSYNRTNNFNENITISGISNNGSIADAWIYQADGTRKNDLSGAAWLANQTYLIDTLSGSNTNYGSIFSFYGDNTKSTYGQSVKRVIENTGYSGKHALSIGGNFSNKFYFGATLGISKINYTGHYQHIESDDSKLDLIYDFKGLTYTDHFEASGTGYSLDLGAIYKPVDFVRLGGAVHTPVVYRISEYYYDNITSEFDNPGSDGRTTYEAANSPMRYKYTLTAPFTANMGIAFQIKKYALLSADYEYVDYRLAQFSKASDDYNYSNENQDIKNILKSASNLKFGAEFRIKNVYLRGGYSNYGKAFSKGEINQDQNYNIISGGIGMRQQNFYFDLAYSARLSKSNYIMYYVPSSWAPAVSLEPASIQNNKSSFTATIGFKF